MMFLVVEHEKDDVNLRNESTKSNTDGTFVWSKNEQGLVLGSYFWGYFVTQVMNLELSKYLSFS